MLKGLSNSFYLYAGLFVLIASFFLIRVWNTDETEVEESEDEVPTRKTTSPAAETEAKLFLSEGEHVLYFTDASPLPVMVEILELRDNWALVEVVKGNALPFAAPYTSLYIPVEPSDT